MMKFLVLGCNGMAGHTISLYLKEQGHDVTGFAQEKSRYVDSVVGDARDVDFMRNLITKGKYDTVINCIGILNQFAEQNKALATFLNSYFPHFLAEVTSGTDTQVIHMSTDCVFSGKRGEYTEDDFRDGETFYDRSKALGELEDDKNVTLRNSIVGPDINPNGIGLMNWFMKQNAPISGYTKAMWTGQTTLQLAKTMEVAAKERASGSLIIISCNRMPSVLFLIAVLCRRKVLSSSSLLSLSALLRNVRRRWMRAFSRLAPFRRNKFCKQLSWRLLCVRMVILLVR